METKKYQTRNERKIEPEEIVRRAEDCSYLTDQDVESITDHYRKIESQIIFNQ